MNINNSIEISNKRLDAHILRKFSSKIYLLSKIIKEFLIYKILLRIDIRFIRVLYIMITASVAVLIYFKV